MQKRTVCVVLGVVSALCFGASRAEAGSGKTCSSLTSSAFQACKSSAESDGAIAEGVCRNLPAKDDQKTCLSDARDERQGAQQDCRDQRAARRDVCDQLGEAPYAPSFAPADFDTDFVHPTHPNSLFPLKVGDQWTYVGGGELDHIEIRNATKSIEGVTCVVSHDVVTVDGALSEDTSDWIAQAKNGDVFYCGEQTAQYETFPGDDPNEPELVGTEGSFKTGRDGDLPGILMLAQPTVGAIYRQEFSLGTAEDLAEVLSTTYQFGQSADLDSNVPQALAQLLCSEGNCLVTREFSPLEPDTTERKYYAPGIGDFLEIEVESATVTQLVSCNFDPRCAMLPEP
ncbi:MAG TPA: hypothetical protein VMR50_07865 [Myxococcota bacterium]|nr:hypothetical protein [Myxococcota bacterium]